LAVEAGIPPGVLNVLPGYCHTVGKALALHMDVDTLVFTGSTRVAKQLMIYAGESNMKRVWLEAGGKSPNIVFADAPDLRAAAQAAAGAIAFNQGEVCTAGSRLLVDQAIYEPLLERLGAMFESLRAGPANMDLDLGPLIRQSQQQRVWDFLSDAQADNITMVAQGSVVDEAPEAGFYQAPTLLRDVPVQHRLAQQEIFGPVLCAMAFRDEDHAVALANATQFGLVAGVWTADGARQFRMARRIRSGQVFINNYGAGGGVELPFGGVKSSGYGREKGFEALQGFTTLKTVAIKHG
jgi:aldehyde dehydrogenase (NAD+)